MISESNYWVEVPDIDFSSLNFCFSVPVRFSRTAISRINFQLRCKSFTNNMLSCHACHSPKASNRRSRHCDSGWALERFYYSTSKRQQAKFWPFWRCRSARGRSQLCCHNSRSLSRILAADVLELWTIRIFFACVDNETPNRTTRMNHRESIFNDGGMTNDIVNEPLLQPIVIAQRTTTIGWIYWGRERERMSWDWSVILTAGSQFRFQLKSIFTRCRARSFHEGGAREKCADDALWRKDFVITARAHD